EIGDLELPPSRAPAERGSTAVATVFEETIAATKPMPAADRGATRVDRAVSQARTMAATTEPPATVPVTAPPAPGLGKTLIALIPGALALMAVGALAVFLWLGRDGRAVVEVAPGSADEARVGAAQSRGTANAGRGQDGASAADGASVNGDDGANGAANANGAGADGDGTTEGAASGNADGSDGNAHGTNGKAHDADGTDGNAHGSDGALGANPADTRAGGAPTANRLAAGEDAKDPPKRRRRKRRVRRAPPPPPPPAEAAPPKTLEAAPPKVLQPAPKPVKVATTTPAGPPKLGSSFRVDVEMAAIEMAGGLSKNRIRTALERKKTEAHACMRRALARGGVHRKGRVNVKATITVQGRLRKVTAGGLPGVGPCLEDAYASARMPHPDTGAVPIEFSLAYSTRDL
ncbi:MAG: hypothetical protein RL846_22785, partial [Deltaproteobacteria bacterium]